MSKDRQKSAKKACEQQSLFNEAEVTTLEEEPESVVVEQHTRKPKRTKGELKLIGRELVRRELNFIPARAYITDGYAGLKRRFIVPDGHICEKNSTRL
jgi:hypothetical protein